jgi:RNA polymerase sigma-70 factor (ECF subfamily)
LQVLDPRPAPPPDQARFPSSPARFADEIAEHLGSAHRIARGILGSEDLAGDAVQEALVALWRAGLLPAAPSGWLVRAVVHRSLQLIRGRGRRALHEARASRLRSEVDVGSDPQRRAEERELGERIAGALDALPGGGRAAFVLRELEGLDYESIAERLGVPPGTVRSRLNRARAALQGRLRGEAGDGEGLR